MPKIHKLQHDLVEIKKKEEEISNIKSYYASIPIPEFELMLFGCICGHYEVSHMKNGECGHNLTGLCNCKQFIPKNLEIKVEITNVDIFEFEVKDHSERDTLYWFNEFNLWKLRKENEKSSILCNY